ncbi:MAG: GNAT family N-acetyltransferase [Polyangiaceae bacterium]|nr:GNAT family N-acetyltransferase [Polyangiaceae bacterium]
MWDLDWEQHLPWEFENVRCEAGTFGEALPFIAEHYSSIFGLKDEEPRFHPDPMTEAKRRFGDEMDVFLFRAKDRSERVAGVLACHPSDWSTYYIRSLAVLPEYRTGNLVPPLILRLSEVLSAVGCERLECETSPSNTVVMRVLPRIDFILTASSNSERWGTMVRFTKFLRRDAESAFQRQFCGVRVKSARPSEGGSDLLPRRMP